MHDETDKYVAYVLTAAAMLYTHLAAEAKRADVDVPALLQKTKLALAAFQTAGDDQELWPT